MFKALALSLLLAGLPATPKYSVYKIDVISVYDGDTLTADIYLGLGVLLLKEKIRLCGINAPEWRPLRTRKEATITRDRLLELVNTATVVEVLVPHEKFRDNFGRVLGYIVGDGVNLNYQLRDEGLAKPYRDCGR